MRGRQRRGSGIELFHFAQQPGGVGEAAEDRRLALGEFPRHGGGDFDDAAAVGRQRVARLEGFLLAGLEFGRRDFLHLVPQQGDFAFQRGLVAGEAVVLLAQAPRRCQTSS